MSDIYTTLNDLIDAEIAPALDGVSEDFSIDSLVAELRERDLIIYREFPGAAQRNGFELITDENGDTPGFWGLVEQLDAK